MGRGRVYEILARDGYPFLVARVFTGDPGRAARAFERLAGRTGLCWALSELETVSSPEPPRIAPSFNPADWSDPEAWGSWRWPWTTLEREGACRFTAVALPLRPVEVAGDVILSPELTAYAGLGVVAEDPAAHTVTPVGVLLLDPPRPRPLVVLGERWGPAGVEAVAVTGDPRAVGILRGLGFQGEPPLLRRAYPGEEEMLEGLARAKRLLESAGVEVFMLGTLERRVKRAAGALA